ncbi:hypothetical protein ACU4GI_32625 [Cupriavidus basilensis]
MLFDLAPVPAVTPVAPEQLAAHLNVATQHGDLTGAYAIIARLSDHDTWTTMLYAGYSVSATKGPQMREDAQRNIVSACQRRTTGFGLRAN